MDDFDEQPAPERRMVMDRRQAQEEFYEGVENRKEIRRKFKDRKAHNYYYFPSTTKTNKQSL